MKRMITLGLASTLLALSLSGCGGQAASSSSSSSSSSSALTEASTDSVEPTTITFATPGKALPFNYVTESGDLDGYEIAIMKEIDARLDDIEIEFAMTGEFSALFPGLESGQYDIIGSSISWKQERADTYQYSSVPYFHSPTVIGVRTDDTSINSIDDLVGKHIAHISGTAQAMWLEAWNEQNPDKRISIDYVDASAIEIMQMVATGRYDACLHSAVDFSTAKRELGIELKMIEIENADEIQKPDSYFLYAKDNTALQEKIDAVLQDMIDDGTMSSLCMDYFDMDMVPGKE